jgi:hypothetical protein
VRFSITWNGGWRGYSVSVPELGAAGEPVSVVTLDEHEAVLHEIRNRVGNFGGFQRSERAPFYVSRDDVLRLVDEYLRSPTFTPERSDASAAQNHEAERP